MSYFRFSVGCGEEWTRTTELRRGQIYSLLQLPLCDSPSLMHPADWLPGFRADEGTRTPDRLITNQLLYQLSYIGTFQPFKQLFSLQLRLQKYYFFHIQQKFFLFFFTSYPQTVDFLKNKSHIFFSLLLYRPQYRLFFWPSRRAISKKIAHPREATIGKSPQNTVIHRFKCEKAAGHPWWVPRCVELPGFRSSHVL